MTAVLVHGAPVTPQVWEPLLEHLTDIETVTPHLPGFGRPLPDGFEPTMHRLADWLAAELAAIDGPIDFVGQDWGALLAVKVLADRPQSIRSWVLDAADLDADFVWHGSAQRLQSPDGDALIDAVVAASVDERRALFADGETPARAARLMAEAFDRTMGDTLLCLYRSAVRIGTEWGPGIDSIRGPGLVIDAERDPYRTRGSAARFAARTGARLATLPERGHWWMLEEPAGAARMLREFWATL